MKKLTEVFTENEDPETEKFQHRRGIQHRHTPYRLLKKSQLRCYLNIKSAELFEFRNANIEVLFSIQTFFSPIQVQIWKENA